LRRAVKDLFTGKDGATQDMGRWAWAGSWFAVVGHSIWSAFNHATTDVMQLAQALAVIAAAHGGALWAKKDTEPPPAPPP